MAVSALDTPTQVLITESGAKGDAGANGTNGVGFSQVRTNLLNNPVFRIFKRNQAVSVLTGPLAFERNSVATYIDIYGDLKTALNDELRLTSNGYRFDGEATNLFLNSTAPATQFVNLTLGDYVLSMSGTGSVSSIDGSATDGSPLLFNNSGNIEFVVAGTVDRFQLESGSCVTSFITTTGTSATREKDTLSFDSYDNMPNVENAFSLVFGVSSSCNDFCVIDSTQLRVSVNASGNISVNGISSTAAYGSSNAIVFDGVDTLIYVDGTLTDTISVTYTNATTGSVSVASRLDFTKPLYGELLDILMYDTNINTQEAEFLKG